MSPSRHLMATWIRDAWERISEEDMKSHAGRLFSGCAQCPDFARY